MIITQGNQIKAPSGVVSFSGCANVDEMYERVVRVNATLPIDAQKLIDKRVVQVGVERLIFIQRLIANGLTVPLPNWLAVMQYEWEKESRSGNPIRTMTPGSRGELTQTDRVPVSIPIYATVDYFSLHDRLLQASRRSGQPLDTTLIGNSTRRVNEWIEDAGLHGGIQVGGHTSPGLFNAPNVNTFQYTGGAVGRPWDDSSKTGEHILEDVLRMAEILHDNKKYGPYELFVTSPYDFKLNEDFKANSDKTIRQRLQELTFAGRPLQIFPADQIAANRTAMVQMTDDVVEVIVGDQPSAVTWTIPPGWEHEGAIIACVCPKFNDDYEGNSGIVTGNV